MQLPAARMVLLMFFRVAGVSTSYLTLNLLVFSICLAFPCTTSGTKRSSSVGSVP